MTSLRKIVDSSTLTKVFDLPPAFKNKKVEIIMFPVEEKKLPSLTKAQVEEWAKVPEIQALVGALKTDNLPANINIKDIRDERLAEKFEI